MINNDREIDLFQIFRILRKNAKYIVVITVVFGLLGLLVSGLFMKPVYQADAKMIVYTRNEQSVELTNDQLTSAKNLVETYSVVITSRDVLSRIITELELNMSERQLKSCIQVQAVGDTQVMQVIVQHTNRNTAVAVVEKILEIAPDVLVETVKAGSVETVEKAHADEEPVSPRIFKNAAIAALVGFALACVAVVVLHFVDNTYKSELDIQTDLGVPVLGVIPAIESCRKNVGYGRRPGRPENESR